MAVTSRDRMLGSIVEMLRERGYSGTGLRDVIDRSGAPRGSIYHHFPRGKAQMAQEGIRAAAAQITEALEPAARSGDPIEVLRTFISGYRSSLEASDFRLGCPLAAAANEFTEEAPELAAAAVAGFGALDEIITECLLRSGIAPFRARRIAVMVLCSIEGATLMCRAYRDTWPLDEVGEELEATISAASAR